MTVRFGIRPIGPLGRGVAGSKSLVSESVGLALGLGARAGGGGGGVAAPIAPVLTLTSTPGDNPPSWSTAYTDLIIDTDEILMRFRVNGGAWVDETPVPVTSAWFDDYVTDGLPFPWPEFSADAPFPAGALIEVQEGIDRNGTVVWSTILSDTMNNSAQLTFHQQGIMNYGFGTTPQPLTGGSFAINPADKLVVAINCIFNGDQLITGVTMNGGTITLTRVGPGPLYTIGGNDKVYLYYVDAPGVSQITSLSISVSGSTNSLGYSIYSVNNSANGPPAATFATNFGTGSTNPLDADGGLAATSTGALALVGMIPDTGDRNFVWTGAAEQAELQENNRKISTAFQIAGTGGPVTLLGGSGGGLGFSGLWLCNALWDVA